MYAPALMLKVWLYGYALGMTSARRLEQRIVEDLALRYLAGGQRPDNWALSAFRRRHGRALNDAFTQVVELARELGMGKLGMVALDNGSYHQCCAHRWLILTQISQQPSGHCLRQSTRSGTLESSCPGPPLRPLCVLPAVPYRPFTPRTDGENRHLFNAGSPPATQSCDGSPECKSA